ncbi:chromatin modification- protein VID21 [Xylographa carneopallida]|nr:chromatin modification- protein VID21 [Xylographa carneopallida]
MSAEKAMIQAEASQAADLRDARKAFMVAQQLPAPVQERAPHWLASTQFALDKVQEGLASASKADVARVGKIAVAANVAMRLSEYSFTSSLVAWVCLRHFQSLQDQKRSTFSRCDHLSRKIACGMYISNPQQATCLQAYMAQQLAFTMVKSADWSSALTGGLTLLGNTSIGMEWVFNHQSAQNDVLAAVAKLGRLVALWRKRDQALKDKAAGKDKGRILDQLESMLEKLPESEVQQVYALLDLPIDELRAKAGKSLSTAPLTHSEERQRSEQGPMKGALGGKKKRKKVEEEVASAQGLLQQASLELLAQLHDEWHVKPFSCEQADVILGEQQEVAGGLQAGKVDLQADTGQAAAQDASAHQPEQGQGQGGASAVVAEAKDAVSSVELQRQRAKKQSRGQQKQHGPHPLLADEPVQDGVKPEQQQGVQLVPGEKATEREAQQQGPHPLLAEEVVESGKKPGQQQGLQLSQAGTLAGEGQHAQQQPQQQQGPHVLLDEKLTEAEEAAAAERMQGIAAGARQDESQQQA